MQKHSRRALTYMLIPGLVVSMSALGCASRKSAELELTREVRYDRPVIRTVTSAWSDAQAPRPSHLQVEISGDPGLVATFDIQGVADHLEMQETTQPGVYRGTYVFADGQTGSFPITGRLSHAQAGEVIRAAAPVIRTPPATEAAQAVSVCNEDAQAAVQRELLNLRVEFTTDSSDLNRTAKLLLKRLVLALPPHSACSVVVQGHADQRGGEAHNLELGLARARSVIDHLVAGGVPAKMLVAKSFGSARPLSKDQSPGALQQNRRVDFSLGPPGA